MWIITSALTNPNGIQAFYTEFANFCGNFACVIVAAILLAQVNVVLTIIVLLWSLVFLILVIKKNIRSNKVNMEHSRLFREQRYLGDIAQDNKYTK